MKRKTINSQLSNFQTYNMYMREMLVLAENVFVFKNLPNFIDVAYLNKTLLRKGSIAFFYDEVLESVVALPYTIIGNLDIYGRPLQIAVNAVNGYHRILNKNEFVIMYDNNGYYPLYLDLAQRAERISRIKRTIDINIKQQQTPRIWKTKTNNERTLRDLIDRVDAYEETIATYKTLEGLDDVTCILEPSPYVSDKLRDAFNQEYAEFLQLIGITSITEQKKERLIQNEVNFAMGGTIASRFSRFEPRKRAIELINEKFKDYLDDEIIIEYYDSTPTTKESEANIDESMAFSIPILDGSSNTE